MAHMIETMAYAGETPWHGLGVKVPADLSPRQMMEKAGLDWTVDKYASFVEVDGKRIRTGVDALVRSSDNRVLTNVGEDWNPVQNSEAFAFFAEYCAAGDMEMHTAGSLKNGEIVWVLAKVNESFDVVDNDRVDSFLLFSNPHQYGKTINVRFTPIRVVCNNTLTLSLNAGSKNEVRLNHRREFNPELVKEQLGIAHEKFAMYRDVAKFLSSKRATRDNLVQYFNNVFPLAEGRRTAVKTVDDLSRTAKSAFEYLETQPGAEYARGTWWQAVNTVTYMTDHVLGRSADTRLQSAWFGANQVKKVSAMNLAKDMAMAA
jgi:phage/plasmid-like protein (TIGR03299 family)